MLIADKKIRVEYDPHQTEDYWRMKTATTLRKQQNLFEKIKYRKKK